ncbi:hypothetical protein IH601_03860, partial [Candidatus Bipolaricaulota bacterium]|nr:hypothetical protein [Candidatus Bipolaricaulota bacterium]
MDEIQRSFWIRMPRPVHQVIRKCLRLAIRLCRGCVRVSVLAVFFTIALVGRYRKKRIDVGLGPEPLINNVYHKRALERLGYTAETFVNTVFFITDEFDLRVDEWANKGWWGRIPLGNTLRFYLGCAYLATLQLTRYRCLYIYFHGGELGHLGGIVARCEPFLLRVARVKVVVMPYGGDVHDMSRCPTLSFKHAMSCDYPLHCLRRPDIATRIDRWTRHADHVISGCDWVDYMHHWDTLTLGHFSIDTQQWKPDTSSSTSVNETLRILHAPNHRTIKGSGFFVRAVNELRDEGVDVELVVLEGV